MDLELARVAKEEARKNYHGDTIASIGNLQPLCELFDVADDVTLDSLNRDWSGAFAFLCVQNAGYGLPVRYPDPRVKASFAKVSAWVEYARLPKISLWSFPAVTPEVGDLIVFDPKPDVPHTMGVVLSVREGSVEVAVGNYHNHSAVIEHSYPDGVFGLIRLPR